MLKQRSATYLSGGDSGTSARGEISELISDATKLSAQWWLLMRPFGA